MMYKNLMRKFVAIGLSVMLIAVSCYTNVYAKPDGKEMARKFLENVELKKASGSTNGGLKPTVYKDAYRSHPSQKNRMNNVLPSAYDLRKSGLVTVIKNQSPWGSCWSFGALSALESNMLVKREATGTSEASDPDFSELQLAWSSYSKQTPTSLQGNPTGVNQVGEGEESILSGNERLDAGGNVQMAITVLGAWQGAANEHEIPYQAADGSKSVESDWSVDEEKRNITAVNLQNADFLPNPVTYSDVDEEGMPDSKTYTYDSIATATIKDSIMKNGVVEISYYADQSLPDGGKDGTYFSYSNWCQYVDEYKVPNHAVSIVGWDDNYASSNFASGHQPDHNGAWLVKNSWGSDTDWGIDGTGYFWLSYYDYTLCGATSLQGEELGKYTKNYQYDYLSLRSEYLLNDLDDMSSVANVFTANSHEQLKAVSVVTSAPASTVEIKIYKLPSGRNSGVLASDRQEVASQTRVIPYSGYHTIDLDTPVILAEGETFAVVETIRDSDGYYYMPIEMASVSANQKAVCNEKESYAIQGGEAIDIHDIEMENQDPTNPNRAPDVQYGNVMIKAFTVDKDTTSAPTLTSFTYQEYDNIGEAIGTVKTHTNIDNTDITLSSGVGSIKITGVQTEHSSTPTITVKGTSYKLNDTISRADFSKTEGEVEPIVITTQSEPLGTKTNTYKFAFSTTPITIAQNGITMSDTGYHLAQNVAFTAIDVADGADYDAIKAALEPLGASDQFNVYNLALSPELTSEQKVNITFMANDDYVSSEKTKVYYASLRDHTAILTEIADDSAKTKKLSADINNMGYYVLAQVKDVPEVPVLSAITYAPNKTLADVTLPTVEGGVWSWDTTTTVPTVNITNYPATFTPDSGSKYCSYKADIKLTVHKATPELSTVEATAITYGQKLSDSTLSGQATCNGVSVTGTISWNTEIAMPVVKDSNNTLYPVQFVPDDTINYHSVTFTQKVVVNKKAIMVTADSTAKLYGDENPIFNFTVPSESLVGTDTMNDLAVVLTSTADKTTNAGTTVPITGTSTAENYTVTVESGMLTINKRPIGCIVNDVKLTYGDALPATFDYTVTNLVNGATASSIGATATIKPKDLTIDHLAGTYELKVTDFNVTSSNYTNTGDIKSGVLTIQGVNVKNVKNTSSIPDSFVDLFEVYGNLDGTEVIHIKDVKDKNILKLFKTEVKKQQILGTTFDLSLDGLQGDLKGVLTVTLPVDAIYNGEQITVLHFVEAGKLTADNKIATVDSIDKYENITVVDGKVTIKVYSLSPFAMITPASNVPEIDPSQDAPKDTQVTTKPVGTGDNTSMIYFAFICLGSLAVMTTLIAKKSKKEKHSSRL